MTTLGVPRASLRRVAVESRADRASARRALPRACAPRAASGRSAGCRSAVGLPSSPPAPRMATTRDVTAAAEAKLREARDKSKNGAGRGGDTADAAPPGATATVSAADVRRAEQKARAEAAVLSEYQTGEDDGDAGWDAKEVEEMSKKYEAFLKASKAKKWWSRGD